MLKLWLSFSIHFGVFFQFIHYNVQFALTFALKFLHTLLHASTSLPVLQSLAFSIFCCVFCMLVLFCDMFGSENIVFYIFVSSTRTAFQLKLNLFYFLVSFIVKCKDILLSLLRSILANLQFQDISQISMLNCKAFLLCNILLCSPLICQRLVYHSPFGLN